ncbi:hypothetical protein BASA62_006355 [Batrachochytrium salamandrivorans]|nr:hypothetical protein BASA62_006355 [Batrachochytrium salamandrivorans]
MIALSRSSTKLTVRNDVMTLLLTLFLPACSLNEVPGINDAVQNVFTFFSSFRNTPSRNPQRVGTGCTKPGRVLGQLCFLKFELPSDDEKK